MGVGRRHLERMKVKSARAHVLLAAMSPGVRVTRAKEQSWGLLLLRCLPSRPKRDARACGSTCHPLRRFEVVGDPPIAPFGLEDSDSYAAIVSYSWISPPGMSRRRIAGSLMARARMMIGRDKREFGHHGVGSSSVPGGGGAIANGAAAPLVGLA